ncbi:MAG TPA: four helix bundle protein [Tepidiformaceae bacterium]|nr:four helix bundle protein [Tepidiformaceae bacterium]
MNDRPVQRAQELRVYKQAMVLAMAIFDVTATFPTSERYSLTDQIRRSSRSICANLAEAWQKRLYRAAFVSKLSDSAGEAAETTVWLEFAEECGYLPPAEAATLSEQARQVTAQLVAMMTRPEPWLLNRQ